MPGGVTWAGGVLVLPCRVGSLLSSCVQVCLWYVQVIMAERGKKVVTSSTSGGNTTASGKDMAK